MNRLCYFPILLLACVAGCGGSGSQAPINAAGDAASTPDPVEDFLAERPATIQRGDLMELQGDAGNLAFPDAFLLYLYSAQRRYPKMRRFRAAWRGAVFGHSLQGVATYDRQRKTLWYRYIRDERHELWAFTGVTPQVLLRAGTDAINTAGRQGGHTSLTRYGCKRLK